METSPKDYLNKTTEELEEICKGISFSEIASASDDKKAAFAAYTLRLVMGGEPGKDKVIKTKDNRTDILKVLFNIYSSKKMVSQIVENVQFIKEINEFIDTQPDKEQLLEHRLDIDYMRQVMQERTPSVKTRYPNTLIVPTDKISNLAFSGELIGHEATKLAMERRGSKKQITTLASIDFDSFDNEVQIKGRKKLTAYDREVHDAIITLSEEGGNEYITPQMIYQVMTGDPNASLETKQAEAISESITKCMYSKITIDAKEEATAYGFDDFKYDGHLISGERVTATLNGTVTECLHLLGKPILYVYADKKNQIGRVNLKLLNSPINKTEEIITLQGYLYRRILSMNTGKSGISLSKTIVYETLYNQIELTASSDGALRKKKAKIRDQVKRILDFWKSEDFIRGYSENKKANEIYSITIKL